MVAEVHPTTLIGTSTQADAFTEAIIKDMAAHLDRQIILPLSNHITGEAVPADLIAWTLAARSSPTVGQVSGSNVELLAWWAGALVLVAYSAVLAGIGSVLTLRPDVT